MFSLLVYPFVKDLLKCWSNMLIAFQVCIFTVQRHVCTVKKKRRLRKIYLSSLCLLMQQGQSCQILQEGMRRVKHLGQKLESFTLIMVQHLSMKMNTYTDEMK